MQLKNYQAYVHEHDGDVHVDVELHFKGQPTIKMCDCSAYLGGTDSFGDLYEIAARVREDLNAMSNAGDHYVVKQDTLDGSIDVFRERDGALMFSMECERLEGADWVEKYSSVE